MRYKAYSLYNTILQIDARSHKQKEPIEIGELRKRDENIMNRRDYILEKKL